MWNFGRAPRGGEIDVINGKVYKGGEILPFYVPRPIMPQIDEVNYTLFLAFIHDQSIAFSKEQLAPSLLRPHQRIDKFKAERMSDEVRAKPIFISEDMYILDGNHRWLAHMMEDTPIDCWKLHQPFEQAIDTMFSFPYTFSLQSHLETN